MQVLIALLGLLSAIGVWYWRLQMAARAARGARDVVRTAVNLPRRLAFLSKSRRGGVQVIDDPREAAAVMLTLVGEAGSGSATAREAIVSDTARRLFDFSDEEAGALAAHAAWIVRTAPQSPQAVMSKLAGVVLRAEHLEPKDLVELDQAFVEMSEAGGAPLPAQMRLLQIYRDKAGIRA